MGVLGKDLLDFHRPRTNTKVEFGASGYWVESHPTMQPYGAVLTEILNLDAVSRIIGSISEDRCRKGCRAGGAGVSGCGEWICIFTALPPVLE